MRFPGNRNAKYYFPVTRKSTRVDPSQEEDGRWYVLGLDEVLVDIEVHGELELAEEMGFVHGQSVHITTETLHRILERLNGNPAGVTFTPGGTVANTLCNYTHLSGEPAMLLGAIEECIRPGEPAFAYVAQTPAAVNLDHLLGMRGSTGVAITFVTPDGERAFGVAPGIAGDYPPEAIPEEAVLEASVVVTSLYCFVDPNRPIAAAAERLMRIARDNDIPVAFGLGTAGLVQSMRPRVRELLAEYVSIAAMNRDEAEALTGESDALLASEQLLELVDTILITEGPRGLTLAGWTDETTKRETRMEVRSKTIPEYNRWEFSRLLRRDACENPLKVYSHIHPYRGGPDRLSNTSGAGDAALAALLHDISANDYHRNAVPGSRKHPASQHFLTYSSISRNAQYCNRVAYEVLKKSSPRLDGAVGHDEEDQGTLDRE